MRNGKVEYLVGDKYTGFGVGGRVPSLGKEPSNHRLQRNPAGPRFNFADADSGCDCYNSCGYRFAMSSLKMGYAQLVAQAEAEIRTLSVQEAQKAQSSGALLVDLRDVREIKREGKIPDSYHVPRGMLEFWADPDCEYHQEALTSADQLVLYCNLGWRSALATKTLQDMGFTNVSHIAGGLTAWKDENGPVEGDPT